MLKTTVYLENDLAAALRQLATREGRPQAELIREAILEYARRRKRHPIPGLGEFDSGQRDTSATAKEILKQAARQGKFRKQASSGASR